MNQSAAAFLSYVFELNAMPVQENHPKTEHNDSDLLLNLSKWIVSTRYEALW